MKVKNNTFMEATCVHSWPSVNE